MTVPVRAPEGVAGKQQHSSESAEHPSASDNDDGGAVDEGGFQRTPGEGARWKAADTRKALEKGRGAGRFD